VPRGHGVKRGGIQGVRESPSGKIQLGGLVTYGGLVSTKKVSEEKKRKSLIRDGMELGMEDADTSWV